MTHPEPAAPTAATDAAATDAATAAPGGARPLTPRDLLVRTAAELRDRVAAVGEWRGGGPVAVVMTMGALHAGHAALIRRAREEAGATGTVVVTVFVNPLQFGPGEDLDRYPRTLDADLEVAVEAGADVVFAPAVEEVYPGGEPRVRIAAGLMGDGFEGVTRPGHFDGMLTVVAKLLHLTRPDLACFGEKDAQQLALIRRMVTDLNFPVRIVGVPTVREPDGLALSSRNRYLTPAERGTALALSRALFAGRDAVAAGAGPAEALAAAHATLEAASTGAASPGGANGTVGNPGGANGTVGDPGPEKPSLRVDYLALIDPADFTPAGESHTGPAVLAVAARVGGTRLIDNLPLEFGARS